MLSTTAALCCALALQSNPPIENRTITAIAADVLTAETDGDREKLAAMLADDQRARRQEANARELAAWRAVKSRADWERFRDERIEKLRSSLGDFPAPPEKVEPQVLDTIEGDGFRIENIVFESRPGLLVTANLYLPAKPAKGMPGIIICHSHHRPKTQGELQDMGMNWARKGCAVLVMDQLGHGERRSHPFASADDYMGEFAISRQDYHFRYDTGIQLHAIGDSLIGWMVWDLMRGVDLLCARDDVDDQKIILLGAVAGGGDPAGVAAALDPRIACVVPFNFGDLYGRPAEGADDPQTGLDAFGGGSWESTRNLRNSTRDGFAPWVIVAAPAPHPFVDAHEFGMTPGKEAAWERLRRIYGDFYDKPDHLAQTVGRGNVRLRPPEGTHCTNIGQFHREQFYPAFEKWFGIPDPRPEYSNRVEESRLLCLEGEGAKNVERPPLHLVAGRVADVRAAGFRTRWDDSLDCWALTRAKWSNALGNVEPVATAKLESRGKEMAGNVSIERLVLHVERDIRVPALLLKPANAKDDTEKLPVVVAVAQAGKSAFLNERADVIAALLEGGVAVCLPDLRGTGETDPGSSRARNTPASSLASTEMMFGGTLLGARLRDLRTLLAALRKRDDVDSARIALWGDSFAPMNAADRPVRVPRDVPNMPAQSEPLGHLLVLLAGLFDGENIAAFASARGGLTNYRDLLESEFVHLPLDAHVPGAIPAGDLSKLAYASTPLRLSGLVNGRNQRVSPQEARAAYDYGAREGVIHAQDAEPDASLAEWLIDELRR
ncbi:MAG: acetylxylan esterase [Planctomycetaceae bacterium]